MYFRLWLVIMFAKAFSVLKYVRPRLMSSRYVSYLPSFANPKKFEPFPFAYHEEVEILFEDMTNMGLGVGRKILSDGSSWVVMAPYVVPQERAIVRIYANFNKHSEADFVRLVGPPSPLRVEPRCKYFGQCGGCQYQHVSIEGQRDMKKRQVEYLMHRIGGIENVQVNDCIGTNELIEYRSKIDPKIANKIDNGSINIGFNMRGSNRVLDIDACLIARPLVNLEYQLARDNLKSNPSKAKLGSTILFREHDNGVATDNRTIIQQTVMGKSFQFVAGEFFQNNPYVLPILIKHVIDFARGDNSIEYLIDTYCGSGLFAICGASEFKSVYGVEVSKASVEFAQCNAKANNIRNAKFFLGYAESIFDKVSRIPANGTCVVIDPPRKGCDEIFLNQLFHYGPKRIVYVSCDPATQARDTKCIVAAGYAIRSVTPFDFFPQTRHIENVICFERE